MPGDLSKYGSVSGAADLSQYGTVQPAASSSWLDDVRDTVKQYWDKINPVTQAEGIATAGRHPIDAAKSYGDSNQQLAKKAEDAFKAGNYAEGVRHSLSYLLNGIPGVGTAIDEAGNKSGSGDYKGAVADTAALATNLVAMKVGPKAISAAAEPGAIPAAVSKVVAPVKAAAGAVTDLATNPAARDVAGIISPRLSHALATADRIKRVTVALRGTEAAPAPPAPMTAADYGSGTLAPGARVTQAGPIEAPLDNPSGALPGTIPPAPPAPANPYAIGGGSTLTPAARASAGEASLAPAPQPPISGALPVKPVTPVSTPPVEPPAAPAAEPAIEGANAKLTPQEQEWLKKRSADTSAKDDVIAQWMADKGMTSADVKPGQPFKDLVAQVNKDLGKKYTTRIDAPDHAARVKAVADLLDSKNATASSTQLASTLADKGVTFKSAQAMTPEQLGLTADAKPKAIADLMFQLQKLELTKAAPTAIAK